MTTKLQAAKIAVDHGVATRILNGRKPNLLAAALAGKKVGTYFPVARR